MTIQTATQAPSAIARMPASDVETALQPLGGVTGITDNIVRLNMDNIFGDFPRVLKFPDSANPDIVARQSELWQRNSSVPADAGRGADTLRNFVDQASGPLRQALEMPTGESGVRDATIAERLSWSSQRLAELSWHTGPVTDAIANKADQVGISLRHAIADLTAHLRA